MSVEATEIVILVALIALVFAGNLVGWSNGYRRGKQFAERVLTDGLAQGSEKHRAWLKTAIPALLYGKPMPPDHSPTHLVNDLVKAVDMALDEVKGDDPRHYSRGLTAVRKARIALAKAEKISVEVVKETAVAEA